MSRRLTMGKREVASLVCGAVGRFVVFPLLSRAARHGHGAAGQRADGLPTLGTPLGSVGYRWIWQHKSASVYKAFAEKWRMRGKGSYLGTGIQ